MAHTQSDPWRIPRDAQPMTDPRLQTAGSGFVPRSGPPHGAGGCALSLPEAEQLPHSFPGAVHARAHSSSLRTPDPISDPYIGRSHLSHEMLDSAMQRHAHSGAPLYSTRPQPQPPRRAEYQHHHHQPQLQQQRFAPPMPVHRSLAPGLPGYDTGGFGAGRVPGYQPAGGMQYGGRGVPLVTDLRSCAPPLPSMRFVPNLHGALVGARPLERTASVVSACPAHPR
jgi:hypothetical protein